MRHRTLQTRFTTTTSFLVLDKGDEVMAVLLDIATREGIAAASFVGLGAFSRSTLAFFDRATRTYLPIPVEEQVEVVSITGNISLFEGAPRIHAHALLSRPDGSTIGGHLVEGTVWPTLELTLTLTPGRIDREIDEESGLPLLRE